MATSLPDLNQLLAAERLLAELARADPRVEPQWADALLGYGEALRRCGRADEALSLLEQALELATRLTRRDPVVHLPLLARAADSLARAYRQAQQFDRAAALFEQAVEGFRILAGADPQAHGGTLIQVMSDQALALAQIGELERAHAVASNTLALAEREPGWGLLPLIVGTRQFLADLAVDLGRPGEAIEHLVAGMRLLREAVSRELPGAREAATRLGASLRELCEGQGVAVPEDVKNMLSSSG